ESDILDFRPANPFQPDRPFAGRQSLGDDSEHRPALKQSCPLDSQHNSQDILAVESVGTDLLERELSGREGLCGHRTVKEERIGPLSCEDIQAFRSAAVLVIHAKWSGLTVWHRAAALLYRLSAAVQASRDIEREIKNEFIG